MKIRHLANLCVIAVILACGFFLCLFHTPQAISADERRYLAQFPAFTVKSVLSGNWTADFEEAAMDQFPFRDSLRSLKSIWQLGVLHQLDVNGIYLVNGSAGKLEYPLNEDSVRNAADKLNSLCEAFLAGTEANVYFSIVPDKNFYLAREAGYPSLDYGRMVTILTEGVEHMSYIDLFPLLDAQDYYRTDPHWSQEKILPAAKEIAQALGVSERLSFQYEEVELPGFYGAYPGQLALPLKADTLTYLTNGIIEACTTWNAETGEVSTVYNEDLFSDVDPYDVFLSGAVPLITITNPSGEPGTELVIFRDSFASSLAPLLIEAYETITLVDLRYMSSRILDRYLTFTDQDVLFLAQWAYPNRILKAVQWGAAQGDDVQFVEMTSFGCGPDAFLMDGSRDLLRATARP